MKKVITMVGTSLFTNYMQKEVRDSLLMGYESILEDFEDAKNRLYAEYDEDDYTDLKAIITNTWLKGIDRVQNKWKKVGEDQANTNASAEIKSILKIQEELKEDIEVYLLATDSVLSPLAADIIKQNKDIWFSSKISIYFNPNLDVIKNLQVADFKNFKNNGLSGLVNRIFVIAAEYWANIILNITGGYKAIIPYLTIMGQINEGAKIYYIFEETDCLLQIPRLPINIDWNLFEQYWQEFNLFEHDEIVEKNKVSYQFLIDCESCLEIVENDIVTNPLAKILWKKYQEKFFLFYASDDVLNEIGKQPQITNILKSKFHNSAKRSNKTETKSEGQAKHTVYDDGNNDYRIYYFEKEGKVYIYKTFENEEAAQKYIRTEIDQQKIIINSKIRKLEKLED